MMSKLSPIAPAGGAQRSDIKAVLINYGIK